MEQNKKPTGPVIRGQSFLHGKRAKLIRGGKEVTGTVESQKGQKVNDKFVFTWRDASGRRFVSPLTGDEIEKIKSEK